MLYIRKIEVSAVIGSLGNKWEEDIREVYFRVVGMVNFMGVDGLGIRGNVWKYHSSTYPMVDSNGSLKLSVVSIFK